MAPVASLFALAPILLLPTEEVESTLKTYVNATLRCDVATLDRLFAQDYVEVSPLGELDPREQTLNFYRVPVEKRPPAPKDATIGELSVRFPAKNVAVAVFREDLEVARSGTAMKISFRVTSVLRKVGKTWLLVSNHATGVRM